MTSLKQSLDVVVVFQATNLISKKELLTMDPDTDDGQLVYEVTAEPKHGFLESKLRPGSSISTFTQGEGDIFTACFQVFCANLPHVCSETMDDLLTYVIRSSEFLPHACFCPGELVRPEPAAEEGQGSALCFVSS